MVNGMICLYLPHFQQCCVLIKGQWVWLVYMHVHVILYLCKLEHYCYYCYIVIIVIVIRLYHI